MKKKWELLKEAYDRYPKGTKCQFADNDQLEASGVYIVDIICGITYVLDSNYKTIYTSNAGWATIIPEIKSILDGKVAVRVDNEREQDLLREYNSLFDCMTDYRFPHFIVGDGGFYETEAMCIKDGYTIIPFADFAKETGLQVPRLLGKSEDGVNIYNKDPLHTVWKENGVWRFGNSYDVFNSYDNIDPEDGRRFFSTKEAALALIEQANKPKEIEVQLFNEFHSAKISNKWVSIRVGKIDSCTTTLFKPSDIEEMYHALKQLQS